MGRSKGKSGIQQEHRSKIGSGKAKFLKAFGKFYEQNWRFLQFLKVCGGGLGPLNFSSSAMMESMPFWLLLTVI